MWGEPFYFCVSHALYHHFNSLAPCGANHFGQEKDLYHNQISTHSPRVGRTQFAALLCSIEEISTHSPRVGRTDKGVCRFLITQISTHSPRVGRTDVVHEGLQLHHDFNSLAPCGANLEDKRVRVTATTFQLTRPVWGEPRLGDRFLCRDSNFNSLAPCGANPL